MDIIRVDIDGPASNGRFSYHIETPGTRLATPYKGLAGSPITDACEVLRRLHAADLDTVVQLYYPGARLWKMQTTVGYGLKHHDLKQSGDPTVIAETAARSEAKPPPRRKRQASPAGTDPDSPRPATPKRSPRKRKPAKSGARPARR